MDKNAKIGAVSAVAGFAAASAAVKFRSYHQDLYGRFPDVDRKIVRKAFRRMLLKALTGQYTDDLQSASDADMDVLFKVEMFNLLNK